MKKKIKKIIFSSLVFVIPYILTGCAGDVMSSAMKSLFSFKKSSVWLQKVSFVVSDKVNDCSPVLVHLVIPYSEDLYKNLSTMTSDDYFSKVNQIRLDNAEKVDIFEWELVRSQRIADETIKPTKLSGEGVLVFAHYTTPGIHRATIGEDESVIIYLNDTSFSINSKLK